MTDNITSILVTKFKTTSCYSFIFRNNLEKKRLEIYFPPNAEIKPDFGAWLKANGFVPSQDNPQLQVTTTEPEKLKAITEIVERSRVNGAYEIDCKTDPNSLPDLNTKDMVVKTPEDSELISTVASRVSELVKQEMRSLSRQIKQEIETGASKAEVKALEKEVVDLEKKLAEVVNNNNLLLRIKQQQEQEILRLQKLLGVSPETSPFAQINLAELDYEEEDITHLNSPFNLDEHDLTNMKEFDETEYNEAIQPAKVDLNPTDDLVNIDIDSIGDEPSSSKKAANLDLNQALNDINLEELDLPLNSKEKSKKNV